MSENKDMNHSVISQWVSTNKWRVFFGLSLIIAGASIISMRTQANSAVQTTQGVSEQKQVTIATTYQHYSEVLSEHREYSVMLPEDYFYTEQPFPVIYLLDGEHHLNMVGGFVDAMSGGFWPQIPQAIIVAIHNTNRMRDYTPTHTLKLPDGSKGNPLYIHTGGAANFIRYLESELVPAINRQYRTHNPNVLIGHSFGGLVALEALSHQSETFQGYVILDPSLWFDHPNYLSQLNERLAIGEHKQDVVTKNAKGKRKQSAFIAVADNRFTPGFGESRFQRDELMNFSKTLKQDSVVPRYIWSQFYPESNHHSVLLSGIPDGLRQIFAGYHIEVDPKTLNAAGVTKQYQQLNARLNSDLKPSYFYLKQLLAKSQRRPEMNLSEKEIQAMLETFYP